MQITLTDNQINLILYCLQMQAHEFSWDEKQDYKGILRAVESAANYAMECDY